ncbi:ADP-ribosylation/Crystallin J1 [Penicillium sp. IBT 16267x]|nr:ADP-ribosylation/Crystallin J1 [Penicillium sp. IBT 16267x]
MTPIPLKSRILGSIWGNCVADALGGPVQFMKPGAFSPITGMEFVPPFHQPAGRGSYSDDGAMTLALAQSLIDTTPRLYDHALTIQYFLEWWKFGRFSTTHEAWDVGVSTGRALAVWQARGLADLEQTGQIISDNLMKENFSGNGSLMRVAPVGVALFFRPLAAAQVAKEQSQVTHPALACVEACQAYTEVICGAMRGQSKAELCQRLASYTFTHPVLVERFAGYRTVSDWTSGTETDIKSSGWVIDTLECALWAFFKFDTWAKGALAVVNLGEDSDTAGAVYGALAGVFYGVEAIPQRWADKMQNADLIREIAEKFAERVAANAARG